MLVETGREGEVPSIGDFITSKLTSHRWYRLRGDKKARVISPTH